MTNSADSPDRGTEPDIIELGPIDAVAPTDGSRATHTTGSRRLRRLVEPGVLAVLAGAMLLTGQFTAGHGPPAAEPGATPSGRPTVDRAAPEAPPRLLVPRTASPGERITVLAFRNARLCGPVELRLDGVPIPHRTAHLLGPADPYRVELLVTVQVPRSARPGRHRIDLYGPVPGSGRGPICADVPEHQAKVATAVITVSGVPRRRVQPVGELGQLDTVRGPGLAQHV